MTQAATSTGHGQEPGDRPTMVGLDLSGSRKIPLLMELVGDLSRARDPQSVLLTFATGFRRLYGPRGYVSLSTRGLRSTTA